MLLELRQLVKHFRLGDGEPVRAVDGVSLSLEEGELVALHGPSGSGKSTLLAIVAGLLAPDSGSVLFMDREVTAMSEREAASYRLTELGLLSQQAELLAGARVSEQASLKLWLCEHPRSAERRVSDLLERLGLGERLSQRCEKLSLGERQRLALAVALSTQPRLLLADEPTGSLDSARGREVLALLRALCEERGVAVLLVTHDPEAVAFADRALELRDGRISERRADESAEGVVVEIPGHGGAAATEGNDLGANPTQDADAASRARSIGS